MNIKKSSNHKLETKLYQLIHDGKEKSVKACHIKRELSFRQLRSIVIE